MGFAPDTVEKLARARADLRMGVPIVASGGLIAAAETLDSHRFAEIQRLGSAALVITSRRADTLKARSYDGDVARIVLPSDATLKWINAIADPAGDLTNPMKGPLKSMRDGDAGLARVAVSLCKASRLLPAAMIAPLENATAFAQDHNLTLIDDAAALDDAQIKLDPIISARLPLQVSEAGRLHVFRPEDGSEEHYAVEIGKPMRDAPVLARLHSACFTGDLLGSLKCDCGPQLRSALGQMGQKGAGVLLYLNQEGRGIGLANKMRAYALQDQGFDTVEANHRLGFEDDERDFRLGAEILRRLGFASVRLLTNNPAKIAKLESCGITVTQRVPLEVGKNVHNADYLATKAAKSGHLL